MALTTVRDKGAVVKFGGGIIKIRTTDDDGGATYGTTVYDLGYIQETTFTDSTDIEDIKDETGSVIQSLEGDRTVKLSGVLMQSDKLTLDIAKETRGNYYEVYYKSHSNVNGAVQEILFGICRIKPMIELASTTRRIPIEITCLKNDTTIPSVNLSTVYGGTATSVAVAEGGYYTIIDT